MAESDRVHWMLRARLTILDAARVRDCRLVVGVVGYPEFRDAAGHDLLAAAARALGGLAPNGAATGDASDRLLLGRDAHAGDRPA